MDYARSANVKEFTGDLMVTFEEKLEEHLTTIPVAWWDTQKFFECCGWDNNTIPHPLATGKFCTTDPSLSEQACQGKLLNTDQAWVYGMFFGILFVSQGMVCGSSCCLACWIQAEEPC